MGAGIGLLLPWENETQGSWTGIWALGMGKKINVKMGMGSILTVTRMGFEHWEVGFGKIWAGKWHWKPSFRTLCLLYVVRACSIMLLIIWQAP